ncbi:PepSY domain-containing protein, partial [Candidatus Woesearchaeota archaeon]|nr:PepSY domain-containing protein [Candidatus Woesearchaeota archaeon]
MRKLMILLICILLAGCANEAAEDNASQQNLTPLAPDVTGQQAEQAVEEPVEEPVEEDEQPITEAEAKKIATRQLGGIATDIDKETRDGVEVYVVEVDPPSR